MLPTVTGSDGPPEVAGDGDLLEDAEAWIRNAEVRATFAVDRELLRLY